MELSRRQREKWFLCAHVRCVALSASAPEGVCLGRCPLLRLLVACCVSGKCPLAWGDENRQNRCCPCRKWLEEEAAQLHGQASWSVVPATRDPRPSPLKPHRRAALPFPWRRGRWESRARLPSSCSLSERASPASLSWFLWEAPGSPRDPLWLPVFLSRASPPRIP